MFNAIALIGGVILGFEATVFLGGLVIRRMEQKPVKSMDYQEANHETAGSKSNPDVIPENHWTPCEKGQPPKGMYMVTIDGKPYGPIVRICYYSGDQWIQPFGMDISDFVTAWAPSPKPYKKAR